MRKILLVRPELEFHLEDVASELPFVDKRAFMVPLDLVTIAALTPNDVDVDLWDERAHGRVENSSVFKTDYDLVGITGYTSHIPRARELGRIFRERHIPVAVGGPGVSAAPERYRDHFDILFIGEAELTWPQFLKDWKAGSYIPEYRQVAKVDMAYSPVPRWDSVASDLKHYLVGGVQTTRGCPFDCTFCDVIYIFGRVQRHKPIDQVLKEVATLERLGMPHLFICDDNFYGDPKYYKALLNELIPLNRSFEIPLSFNTQIDMRVAKDDEMLELLADANFSSLFVGIESPNRDSLIEMDARKNLKADLVEDVKRIHSYGIEVSGAMIVGFDHDATSIFQQISDFLQEACIPISSINILRAMSGTKLWVRLLKEGRVVGSATENAAADIYDEDIPFTNITPRLMTREELLSGFGELVERTRDWHNFEARVKGMISRVKRQPRVRQTTGRFNWRQRLRGLMFLLFSMDREARGTALRLLVYTRRQAPFMIPRVVKMILQNYVWRVQPSWRNALDDQIRREASGEMQLRPLQPVFSVPERFKKPYKAIFPELYDRVYRGLSDKSRADETLVEVVYDFLTRWGPSFQQFQEYHRSFLHEICDRSIAKANGNVEMPIPLTLEGTADEKVDAGEVPNFRRNRLADEVLRVAEQDLRNSSVKPPP